MVMLTVLSAKLTSAAAAGSPPPQPEPKITAPIARERRKRFMARPDCVSSCVATRPPQQGERIVPLDAGADRRIERQLLPGFGLGLQRNDRRIGAEQDLRRRAE